MYHALTCIDNNQISDNDKHSDHKTSKTKQTITRFNVLRGAGGVGAGGRKYIASQNM